MSPLTCKDIYYMYGRYKLVMFIFLSLNLYFLFQYYETMDVDRREARKIRYPSHLVSALQYLLETLLEGRRQCNVYKYNELSYDRLFNNFNIVPQHVLVQWNLSNPTLALGEHLCQNTQDVGLHSVRHTEYDQNGMKINVG